MTLASNEDRNNFRIDSIKVTGDCCWVIESNDGDDYEIVDPENPNISIFYIYKMYVKSSCDDDY